MISWKKIGYAVLLTAMLALSACSAAPQPVVPTAAPTQDLGVVRTQAAQTVVAQITADALANPSATPTQAPLPTETPVPPTETATVAATSTAIATVTKAPISSGGGGGGGSGGGGSVSYPTATGTYPNRALLISQTPFDGTKMRPSEDFDANWTFKNIGTTEWNTHYYIKYQSGDLKPKQNVYMLSEKVAKGDTHTFTADFIAPAHFGRYTSNWVLYDDNGAIIYHMYIVIDVPE